MSLTKGKKERKTGLQILGNSEEIITRGIFNSAISVEQRIIFYPSLFSGSIEFISLFSSS